MKSSTYPEMFRLEQSHFWFIGKQAFIDRAFSRLGLKSPTILDIGCGTGGTTLTLGKWGKVIGLEKNARAVSFARSRGLTVKAGSANKLPFQNSTFTAVTFFDVLYHKGLDEHMALKEAWRVLSPGGYIIITDCAMPSLWSTHDEIMDAKFRFTKKLLVNLVSSSGFEIDTVRSIYALLFPFFVIVRSTKSLFTTPSSISMPIMFINNVCSALLTFESKMFPYFNPPFGSSLLLVARKPVI